MAVNVRNFALLQFPQLNKIAGSKELTIALTETQGRQQEQDQLPPLPPVSSYQGPAQEELDVAVLQLVDGLVGTEIVWHHA